MLFIVLALVLVLVAVIVVPLLPQMAKARIARQEAKATLEGKVRDLLATLADELLALNTGALLDPESSKLCASASATYSKGLALLETTPLMVELKDLHQEVGLAIHYMKEVRRSIGQAD